jgi:hypothetical protein
MHTENSKNSNSVISDNNPLNYLYIALQQLIPAIKLKFLFSNEIEDSVRPFKMKDFQGHDGITIKKFKTMYGVSRSIRHIVIFSLEIL